MGVYSQTQEQATYFHDKENLGNKPQEQHRVLALQVRHKVASASAHSRKELEETAGLTLPQLPPKEGPHPRYTSQAFSRNRKRPLTNSTSSCSCVTLLTNYNSKTNSERKTQVAQNCRKQTCTPSSPKTLPSDLTFQGQWPDSRWGDRASRRRLRARAPGLSCDQPHRTSLPNCSKADHPVGNRNQLWEWIQAH